MELLISLCGTVLLTFVGVLLFNIAERTLKQSDKNESCFCSFPMRGTILSMIIVNLCLALLLSIYYQKGSLVVFRTILTCCILWPCAWADLRAYLIPNRVLLVGMILGILFLTVQILFYHEQVAYLFISTVVAVGALIIVSLFCRLLSSKMVGMGDVKLLGVMGLCLGMEYIWTALFVSFFLMFIVCLVLLVIRRIKRNDSIPFAPFLLMGTIMAAALCGI